VRGGVDEVAGVEGFPAFDDPDEIDDDDEVAGVDGATVGDEAEVSLASETLV
jgi:hypothetical protein